MRIGFIGGGNMAGTIAAGAADSGAIAPQNIYIYDRNFDKADALCKKHGFNACRSQAEAEIKSDIVVIAVKPNSAKDVLDGISRAKAIVSIVAGLSIDEMKKHVKGDVRILRVMPNTPMLVGAGASAFARPCTLTDDEYAEIKRIFAALGMVVDVDEKYLSAVTGVSGSGPAYAYMFIEALSDAGVKHGLKRDNARMLAAQTVYGAAKMVLETGKHPAQLKDEVCSPGGTTIDAVAVLEEMGLRAAVIDAVDACVDKAERL